MRLSKHWAPKCLKTGLKIDKIYRKTYHKRHSAAIVEQKRKDIDFCQFIDFSYKRHIKATQVSIPHLCYLKKTSQNPCNNGSASYTERYSEVEGSNLSNLRVINFQGPISPNLRSVLLIRTTEFGAFMQWTYHFLTNPISHKTSINYSRKDRLMLHHKMATQFRECQDQITAKSSL